MKKIKSIILKKLDLKSDITKNYQDWMNDLEVTKFTEQKYKKHTLKDIRNFVREKNNSKNEFLYGIFVKINNLNTHVGNIKLGPIKWKHKTADISYLLGEKEMWGKGCVTLAIRKIIKIAKNKKLKKLKAATYEMNIGSKKVLIKNGFKLEGILKSAIIFKKKRYSSYIFGNKI